MFGAVTCARTILTQHPWVFKGDEAGGHALDRGLLDAILSLIASAVSSRRSVVQTNGLRCLTELFRYGGYSNINPRVDTRGRDA